MVDPIEQEVINRRTMMNQQKPNLFQRFRQKQIEFGAKARERSLEREEQKLAIQEVREQRQLSQAKVSAAKERISATRAQTSITKAKASRMGGGMLGSFGVQPGARENFFGMPPSTQAKRVRGKVRKRVAAGRKKQRKAVKRITSNSSNNFFGI